MRLPWASGDSKLTSHMLLAAATVMVQRQPSATDHWLCDLGQVALPLWACFLVCEVDRNGTLPHSGIVRVTLLLVWTCGIDDVP